MKNYISIALLTACTVPAAAMAQQPAGIVAARSDKVIQINNDRETPADVLYDTLHYVDGQAYGAGNGNAISGMSIFGTVFDLGLADDFELDGDYLMTEMTEDSVTFSGTTPADGVLVEFFEDLGGVPGESPIACYFATGGEVGNAGFSDTVFGLVGTRISADISAAEICLSAGTHWVSLVPVDDSSSGDWYYTCRNTNEVIGNDSHGRDGGTDHGSDCSSGYGGYGGGYGTNDWLDFGSIGFGAGTASRQLRGDAGCGFTLSIVNSCPDSGRATLTASGGQGGNVAFIYAFAPGTCVIPNGPCAGTVIDLECTTARHAGTASGDPAVLDANAPRGACGRVWVQALDLVDCNTSNVVKFE